MRMRQAFVIGFFLELAAAGHDASSQHVISASIPSKKFAVPITVSYCTNISPRSDAYGSLKPYDDHIIHTVDISIGNPPQYFNVSISFLQHGILMPGQEYECDGSYYDPCIPIRRYDHSLSSTFEPNGTWVDIEIGPSVYRAEFVRDTVHLSGLAIVNETFLEYHRRYKLDPLAPDYSSGHDGMLGLAPPWNSDGDAAFQDQNFLRALSDGRLLDENLFSLKLPHDLNDVGEIMFGGSNPDLYTGDFKTVKLLDGKDVDLYFEGAWNVPISGITLNTSVPTYWPLPNYSAFIMSMPAVVLPMDLALIVLEVIGDENSGRVVEVPCEKRPYLPEFVFCIGGHNLTMTAFDYTMEHTYEDGHSKCMLWLEPAELSLPERTLALGMSFLKGFYTVFDFEERELRCEYKSWQILEVAEC